MLEYIFRNKFVSIFLFVLRVIILLSYWLNLEANQFSFLEQCQLKTKVACNVSRYQRFVNLCLRRALHSFLKPRQTNCGLLKPNFGIFCFKKGNLLLLCTRSASFVQLYSSFDENLKIYCRRKLTQSTTWPLGKN